MARASRHDRSLLVTVRPIDNPITQTNEEAILHFLQPDAHKTRVGASILQFLQPIEANGAFPSAL